MNLPKTYYPFGATPIHPVIDWAKVRKLIRDVRKGAEINPILCWEGQLLAGTHRLAANNILEMLGDSAKIEVWDVEELANEDFASQLKNAALAENYELIQELWDEE